MDQREIAPCSPYLVRPIRTIQRACLEAARTQDERLPECGKCTLRALCAPRPWVRVEYWRGPPQTPPPQIPRAEIRGAG